MVRVAPLVLTHDVYVLERCNPWSRFANRLMSISQLLSSCCYLFTVF